MPHNKLPEPEEGPGLRLKGARYQAGLSQEGVAERLGELWGRRVRQGVYSQWERGENRADDETIRVLAHVYRTAGVDLTPGWLSHGSLSGAPVPRWWPAMRSRLEGEELRDAAPEKKGQDAPGRRVTKVNVEAKQVRRRRRGEQAG